MKIIEQDTPAKDMFTLPEFFIKQVNWRSIRTVGFYTFCSREWLDINFITEPVAVFKVKPRLAISEAGELEAYEMQSI